MVPQPVQEAFPVQQHPPEAFGPLIPQFPGLHSPMVPPVQVQPQAKLTSHALALLNAFKTRDQANGTVADSDLPLRRYTEAPAQPPPPRPQELPAEVSRPAATDSLSQFGLKQTVAPAQNPNLLAPKPISEEQRSALLGLFKSPSTQTALPVRANATALPMTTTPSAVELSAVDTLSSNAARASPAVSHKKASKKAAKEARVPEMNPETNLPFRAMKILARPTQGSDSESPRGNISAPQAQSNGKRPVSRSKAQPTSSPEKPFQPQILKRPQSRTKTTESSAISSPSTFPAMPILPSSNQHQIRPAGNDHKQILQSLLGKPTLSASPLLSQLDRRTTQPAEHKQKLLSLFGAPSSSQPVGATPAEDVLSPLFSIDPTQNASARSRMGSLVSGDGASRRSSQTPMSPADKGFLLSYLDSVAKGVQR
jgi:mRNA-decapping enzyme subunit 2